MLEIITHFELLAYVYYRIIEYNMFGALAFYPLLFSVTGQVEVNNSSQDLI